mgnify:CR=1 FL=1
MFVPHKKIAFSQKRINNVFKNWNHDQNKHRIERLLKYNVKKRNGHSLHDMNLIAAKPVELSNTSPASSSRTWVSSPVN